MSLCPLGGALELRLCPTTLTPTMLPFLWLLHTEIPMAESLPVYGPFLSLFQLPLALLLEILYCHPFQDLAFLPALSLAHSWSLLCSSHLPLEPELTMCS